MPWSFHHKSHVQGKGCIIDMAKAMKYLEQKMQAELGEEEGRLFYYYDLDTTETTTLAEVMDYKEMRATRNEWVDIETPNGRIPQSAFELVDETTTTLIMETETRHRIDADGERIVTEDVTTTRTAPVATGEKVKRLKKAYRLSESGKVQRRATVADLGEDAPKIELWPWQVERLAEDMKDFDVTDRGHLHTYIKRKPARTGSMGRQ